MRYPLLLCFALAAGCASDDDGELVCNGANLDSDPLNCGECGVDCGGGACTMGQCQAATLATGQPIGYVGATDDARGCHLHFEAWSAPGWQSGGAPMDPLPSLRGWDDADD